MTVTEESGTGGSAAAAGAVVRYLHPVQESGENRDGADLELVGDRSPTVLEDTSLEPVAGRALVPADPALDGVVVGAEEEQRLRGGRKLIRVVAHRLPARLQDADTRRQLGAQATRTVALTPFRYPAAVARGTLVASRAWWRWVRVADFYEAAKSSNSLATQYDAITRHRGRRRNISLVVVAAGPGGLWVTELITASSLATWVAGGVTSVGLAIAGRRKNASGRRAVVGPRTLAWAMDGDHLVVAFRDAKAIGKDESLAFVKTPKREGGGWYVVIDLPPSRKASAVLALREALASALAVDETRLILERVRGDAGHAGRLAMWVGDADPYAAKPMPWPLAGVGIWDFWQSTPFGTTARGQTVNLPMVWTSLLVGAIPRMGKTYAARIPATAAALDPFVRLIVFDGKGGKDWRPFELIAHRFGRGDDDAVCDRLMATLKEAAADVARRFGVLGDLDDDLCPESKVTPEITRNAALDMPLVLICIDEIQVYLEDETPVQVGVDGKGKPRFKKRGQIVCDLLTYIAKKGPAAGYMLDAATQKPDAQVIPDKLRGQVGTRFAGKVMTRQASETILGAGTYTAGMDASKLLKSHKGVGLLLGADGETELDAAEAVTVRTFLLEIATIRAACKKGRASRIECGTLTGDAAGETIVGDGELAAEIVATVDADEPVDAEIVTDQPGELPEVLSLLADAIRDDDGRVVATADLAARIGWDSKALGEALRRAEVPAAEPPKRRLPGYDNPVSVTDVDHVRGAIDAYRVSA